MGYSSLCHDPTTRLSQFTLFTNCTLRNALAAVRVWRHHWSNKKVAIACDNLAVVQVLFFW